MERKLPSLVFALALVASACGGGPTAPNPTPGPPPVANQPPPPTSNTSVTLTVSALEGGPVAGAPIEANGETVMTDAHGQATFEKGLPQNADIMVEMAGFLKRETRYQADSFNLCPLGPGFDEDFVRELAYGSGLKGWLKRPPVGAVVYLVIAPEIAGDGRASQAIATAALETTVALGQTFQIVTTAPSTGTVFQVRYNPNLPPEYGEVVNRELTGYTISGGYIEYRSLDAARSVQLTMHALGHVLGLDHTAQAGLMSGDPRLYSFSDFTEAEKRGRRFMLARSPGNRFPDNDRGLLALVPGEGSSQTSQTFSCPLVPTS